MLVKFRRPAHSTPLVVSARIDDDAEEDQQSEHGDYD
jgi:hypothetical protein